MAIQEPQKPSKTSSNDKPVTTATGRYLPCPETQPSKLAYEQFVSAYTPVWMGLFGIIVVFQLYEDFTAMSYLYVCGGLSLPFLLQPILLPSGGFNSPDAKRPLLERYAFKANVWIAVYSFVGNYWYTHCKYCLLDSFVIVLYLLCGFITVLLLIQTHHSNRLIYIHCNRFLLGAQGRIYHAIPPTQQCPNCHVLCHSFLLFILPSRLQHAPSKTRHILPSGNSANHSLRCRGDRIFLLYRLYGNPVHLFLSVLLL